MRMIFAITTSVNWSWWEKKRLWKTQWLSFI